MQLRRVTYTCSDAGTVLGCQAGQPCGPEAGIDPPAAIRAAWQKPTFNLDSMTHLLDHDNHEMRNKFRQFISDPVMTTKMTVQFNLFGGTVLKLGTDRHHNKLLE